MSEQTISSMWVGNPLSHYEQMCLKSFARNGFEIELYCYDSTLSIPEGVVRRDAREIFNEDEVFENKKYPGTYSFFANLFRYKLLSMKETIWVDADVLCLANQVPRSEYLFGYENSDLVNNAVLSAPKDSRLIERLIVEANAFEQDKIIWGQTGPKLLNKIVKDLDLSDLALPQVAFYPIHYRDVWMLFDPHSVEEVEQIVASSTFLHLWNEYLRRAPIQLKSMAPPRNSYLGKKLDDLEIDVAHLEIVDENWARDTWQHVLNPPVSFQQKIVNKLRWEISKLKSSK